MPKPKAPTTVRRPLQKNEAETRSKLTTTHSLWSPMRNDAPTHPSPSPQNNPNPRRAKEPKTRGRQRSREDPWPQRPLATKNENPCAKNTLQDVFNARRTLWKPITHTRRNTERLTDGRGGGSRRTKTAAGTFEAK